MKFPEYTGLTYEAASRKASTLIAAAAAGDNWTTELPERLTELRAVMHGTSRATKDLTPEQVARHQHWMTHRAGVHPAETVKRVQQEARLGSLMEHIDPVRDPIQEFASRSGRSDGPWTPRQRFPTDGHDGQ